MQIVYVDMDNVLVDFPAGLKKLDPEIKAKYKDDPDEIPGFFGDLPPKPGAIEAFKKAKAVSYEPGREYRNANLMARYWLGYAYIQSGQAGLARRELGELERIDQDSEFIDRGSELLDRIGR